MPRRRAYHHGNLRETLLSAAIELIRDAGPAGFTLREVARRAGVSHNAPYRHFRDREQLLGAVAGQGFEELTRKMMDAAGRHLKPLDRLAASGLAYVEFALQKPQHFTVMFDTAAATVEAGARAFQALDALIRQCQQAGELAAGDANRLACVAWSLVHGIAKLAIAGRFPWNEPETLEFARFSIESSLYGLAPRGSVNR